MAVKGELTRHDIVVNGVRLSYWEREAAGEVLAAPMLLLHGLIATGETFGSLVAELPENRRIVALDLPGSGYSARDLSSDGSFAGMAQAVRSFMALIGLERPVLLGHSHGGVVALRLAAETPELLRAMVLIAPANPWSGRERAVIAFYLSWFGRQVARLVPHMPAFVHRIAARPMLGPSSRIDRETIELYRQSGKVPGTVDHILRLLRSWHEDMHELRELLEAKPVEMPVLLLWGDHDHVVPIDSASSLEGRMTQCERFTLPGVGHLPNEERPAECAKLIRTWIIRLGTAAKYSKWRDEPANLSSPV